MGSLVQIGIGCLIASCLVVGLRLAVLGARSRALPELSLGASYLLFGALGYPLAAVARASAASGSPTAGDWLALALAIQNLGVLGCYVFNWRVFRPDATGAGITVAGGLLLLGSWLGHGFDPGWAGARSVGPWYYMGLATRAAAFLWGGAEAFRHWSRMRRRLRIGLADGIVTDRVLMWGVSSLVIGVGFAAFLAGKLGPQGVNAAPVVLVISVCGLAASTAMTLAFFPPAFYLRWRGSRDSER
jgi:hypothetical protein